MKHPVKSFLSGNMVFFFLFNLLILLVFYFLPRLSIPLVIAYILYLIIYPLMKPILKFGFSESQASFIALFLLILLVILPLISFFPNIQIEAQNLEIYLPKVELFVKNYVIKFNQSIGHKFGLNLSENIFDEMIQMIFSQGQKYLFQLPAYLSSFFELLFIIPIFLFFLLKEGNLLFKLYLKLVPNSIFERVYNLLYQFNKNLGHYIVAKFIEASILGMIIIPGLYYLDINFALTLGITAAFTNILPYLGPIIGAIPALIYCLIEYGQGRELLSVGILYLVANILDLAIIFPLLVSRIVNLHPVIVIVSVIVGSHFFGFIGMIISIPLATMFKLILKELYREFYNQ